MSGGGFVEGGTYETIRAARAAGSSPESSPESSPAESKGAVPPTPSRRRTPRATPQPRGDSEDPRPVPEVLQWIQKVGRSKGWDLPAFLVGISPQHLYDLAYGDRHPSEPVADRVIEVFALPERLAAELRAMAVPDSVRWAGRRRGGY